MKKQKKSDKIEICPICKKENPDCTYDPDPFWHNKTMCKACSDKMPCYQQFKKALENGDLGRELERSDREEEEKLEEMISLLLQAFDEKDEFTPMQIAHALDMDDDSWLVDKVLRNLGKKGIIEPALESPVWMIAREAK